MTDRQCVGLMGTFGDFWGAGRLCLSLNVNGRDVRKERSADGFCQGQRQVVSACRAVCRYCLGRRKDQLEVESDKSTAPINGHFGLR